MPAECVLTLDNLRVVRTSMLTKRIRSLDAARMQDIYAALAFATGCDSLR